MDGCFCPQLTVGPPVIGALHTKLKKDVHLMIDDPLEKVRSYVDAGADVLTFHIEATRHPHQVLQALGSSVLRGIAQTLDGSPAAVLTALDRALQRLGDATLITAVVATLRPDPDGALPFGRCCCTCSRRALTSAKVVRISLRFTMLPPKIKRKENCQP